LRKLIVPLGLIAASFALVASTAEAAKTSERDGREASGNAAERGKRPACKKRVDGVLRTIGFSGRTGRLNISCRAAGRIMKRYILHKKLPGQWYCSHLGTSFGKCVDEKELYSEECADREQRCVSSFNYTPGQRA
jgi:hypothetical protein